MVYKPSGGTPKQSNPSTMKPIVVLFVTVTAVLADFPTNCGRSLMSLPDWRIVGGTKAAKGEFPWQIQLNREFTDDLGRRMIGSCGGSIINSQWILTAGHCVADSDNAGEYSVKLAVTDLTKSEGYKALVSKVIYHEDFVADEKTAKIINDIALVKLDGVIDFTKHTDLEPICLAKADTQLTSSCVVSGYGLLNYDQATNDGERATTLNKVNEPIVDKSHCEIYPYFDVGQHVCAGGSAQGGTGFCKGDSGGPLQCKANDGKFYQVGVVSYTVPCGVPNDPDVLTRVSHYIDWIDKTIAAN